MPQTSLPVASPAKIKAGVKPIMFTPAPFSCKRNGRKVRKAIRVAPSITPIAARDQKQSLWKTVQSKKY